jgi:hypothetical protein
MAACWSTQGVEAARPLRETTGRYCLRSNVRSFVHPQPQLYNPADGITSLQIFDRRERWLRLVRLTRREDGPVPQQRFHRARISLGDRPASR